MHDRARAAGLYRQPGTDQIQAVGAVHVAALEFGDEVHGCRLILAMYAR